MGLEDRDRYRTAPRKRGRERRLPGWLVVAAVVGGLVLAGGGLLVIRGGQPALEGTTVSLLAGLPSIAHDHDPLYPPDDQWTFYLADERTCPGGERTDLPLGEQANVMVCLVNFARKQRGLAAATVVTVLNGSALGKADRIVRCQEFKHDPCGQDPTLEARARGYNGAWGENLFIAEGRHGAPRVALDGWLNSTGHRENLFRPEWTTQGIAVRRLSQFSTYRDATLWVNAFGTR